MQKLTASIINREAAYWLSHELLDTVNRDDSILMGMRDPVPYQHSVSVVIDESELEKTLDQFTNGIVKPAMAALLTKLPPGTQELFIGLEMPQGAEFTSNEAYKGKFIRLIGAWSTFDSAKFTGPVPFPWQMRREYCPYSDTFVTAPHVLVLRWDVLSQPRPETWGK